MAAKPLKNSKVRTMAGSMGKSMAMLTGVRVSLETQEPMVILRFVTLEAGDIAIAISGEGFWRLGEAIEASLRDHPQIRQWASAARH